MEQREGACQALIKYLQAALTRSADGAEPLLSLATSPKAPVADGQLLDHRQRILEDDFPQLNMQLAGAQQDQIALNLGELVWDNRMAWEQDHTEREKMKTNDPQEMLGEVGLQKLMRWSQVKTAAELQAIWRDLAMAKNLNN